MATTPSASSTASVDGSATWPDILTTNSDDQSSDMLLDYLAIDFDDFLTSLAAQAPLEPIPMLNKHDMNIYPYDLSVNLQNQQMEDMSALWPGFPILEASEDLG